MKRIIFLLMLTNLFLPAFSQKENENIKKGNKLYKEKKYTNAEIEYRKGLDKNQKSYGSLYNLGNALYKQEKYEEAVEQYKKAEEETTDNKKKAELYHNLGNAYFQQKKYAESANAYQRALKLDPDDDETRYNLAYAQKMLVQQPPSSSSKSDEEDKDNKPQNGENQQQQDQPKKPTDNNQPNPQGKLGNPDQGIPVDQAEQILDELEQKDKEQQRQMMQQQNKDRNHPVEKDW
jgi:tetratricopeptide (TPR) repeat protein